MEKLTTTKTQRLLQSFAAVKLLPEHCNYGDETPALRDFGIAPSIATALIRWGEQHSLVCTFENAQGRSNNAYSWQPAFLVAAVNQHLQLFGETGKLDLPEKLLSYANNWTKNMTKFGKSISIHQFLKSFTTNFKAAGINHVGNGRWVPYCEEGVLLINNIAPYTCVEDALADLASVGIRRIPIESDGLAASNRAVDEPRLTLVG